MPRAAVGDLEAHRPGALAVDLDHEAAEVVRLPLGALDLAAERVRVLGGHRAEERLDVFVRHELDEEVDVVGARAADRDAHGVCATGARRAMRAMPEASVTPVRIRPRPRSSTPVSASERTTAPYSSANPGIR